MAIRNISTAGSTDAKNKKKIRKKERKNGLDAKYLSIEYKFYLVSTFLLAVFPREALSHIQKGCQKYPTLVTPKKRIRHNSFWRSYINCDCKEFQTNGLIFQGLKCKNRLKYKQNVNLFNTHFQPISSFLCQNYNPTFFSSFWIWLRNIQVICKTKHSQINKHETLYLL